MAVVAKSSSESLELLPALSFLSLPTEIRHAIFSCIVPSSMLHISRPGCLLNEKAEDKLYSVACRHMTDVEWIAAALPELHAQEYSSIGRWVNFPNHLACIMSGIGCQPRAHSGWLSLLLTSRFIYREFLPILYSRLKFSFHDWAVFSRFFSVVPADNQAHIRALCVAWGSEAPFRASRTQQITDAMSAEWRGIWSTIQGLPELLSDLDVFVTVRYGMDRTFYKDLPDSEEKALLHEPLRKIQLAPKGRFIVTEIIEARLSTEQIQWTKLTRQVAPAYSIGEPPEERLEFYSKFPFELRWIYLWGKIPSRLEVGAVEIFDPSGVC